LDLFQDCIFSKSAQAVNNIIRQQRGNTNGIQPLAAKLRSGNVHSTTGTLDLITDWLKDKRNFVNCEACGLLVLRECAFKSLLKLSEKYRQMGNWEAGEFFRTFARIIPDKANIRKVCASI